MIFRTQLPDFSSKSKIRAQDRLLLMGSCFTLHIGNRLRSLGLSAQQNPFGIVYHPMALFSQLRRLCQGQMFTEKELHYHAQLWRSWTHHSEMSHPEKTTALELINSNFERGRIALLQANHLVLTFGSSKAFHLKENDKIVSNCHKYPAGHFHSVFTPLELLVEEAKSTLDAVHRINPTINILLTVSPIRHIRDGLIANNRSKARLLLLCEALAEQYSFCDYFPAYELLVDDLREYRFFDKDMTHPNPQAQEYIWNYFLKNNFESEIFHLEKRVNKIRQACNHRPSFPELPAHQTFLQKTLDQIALIKADYPFLNLEGYGEKLETQLRD